MPKDAGHATITYPLDKIPDPGETIQIAEGLYWLRMPLPFALEHINLWLLKDQDGWTIVDTGIHTAKTRGLWEQIFDDRLGGRPVTRVIVTHLHPDHVGCAGWLTERFEIDLWMSREEYLLCRVLVSDTGRNAPEEGTSFYSGAGFAGDQLNRYRELFGDFGRVVSAMPQSYRRLQDGDPIQIGTHEWQILVGRGHSPEHACLFCPELNVLISGDQILPTISSNVSVYPTEPLANPLSDWLKSLHSLKQRLPADVLVLPAHGKPFHGARHRLDALIEEHETGLQKVIELCAEPKRALDVFPALFKSKITDGNLIMATGESVAHLNYLVYEKRLTRTEDDKGVLWYQTI